MRPRGLTPWSHAESDEEPQWRQSPLGQTGTPRPRLAAREGRQRSQSVALLLCSIYAPIMGRRSKAEEPTVFSRLEELRVAQGLSRQELADAVSVHYQTIGYLERGEYSPSLALALHIASVLDVSLEELFSLQPFTAIRLGA